MYIHIGFVQINRNNDRQKTSREKKAKKILNFIIPNYPNIRGWGHIRDNIQIFLGRGSSFLITNLL